ncbi:hypothetical protein H0H81_010397 [Sphagnurus paluster]|uniref:Alternative oxidase n=1 Tax=Sphagnurus paluster TaxID=117069 RepID=A0A9P7GJN6_9AGAR|nr:hypothetical protein H0H81_010397 [Sphagnurus paluster]
MKLVSIKIDAWKPIEDLGGSSRASQLITQPDAVSTVPTMVRGDWVLFHPVYTQDEIKAVQVLHHDAKNLADKLSYGLVKLARSMFDFVSGYKHVTIPLGDKMTVEELRAAGYLLDDPNSFLGEYRWCSRDGRSHLTAPNKLASHEEEAVLTYTRCIEDLEAGRIPEWTNEPAPEIAIDYWRLSPDAKLLDVLYAVRSDETTHRFVNHSLANLNPSTDVNPFALREPDMHVKGKKIAFDRAEAEQYVRESHALMAKKTYMADEGILESEDKVLK